ncbi:hypothetical protein [Bradyrhizobium sp. Tv2a-2]|uniref:hypothetical protein n=1 Tax=Bradyrhizobium sp. Tv2a-2 TaxID=113395 RepID=UPI001FD98F95|nr:hypothetical protein [Bradyrhizobium sp. Tv2a-2]
MKLDKAKKIVREVGAAVAGWRDVAASAGLTSKEIDRMSSAFEYDELKTANAQ